MRMLQIVSSPLRVPVTASWLSRTAVQSTLASNASTLASTYGERVVYINILLYVSRILFNNEAQQISLNSMETFSPRWEYYHRGGNISTAVEIVFHLIHNFPLDSRRQFHLDFILFSGFTVNDVKSRHVCRLKSQ